MSCWNLTGTRGAARTAPSSGERAGDEFLSVSQAVALAKGTLNDLPPLTVVGEVSGFRGPYGAKGHCYFQIKDENCSMECTIWGSIYRASGIELKNGLKMRFTGSFDVFESTGRLKFIARSFAPLGEGLLRQKVAELARKLEREGLTADARKRPVPAFCDRVAVVTSLSGAVIDDVKRTLRRRNPLVKLVCIGSRVQGEGAESELIDALSRAAAIRPAPDCILLVRGGGSFEDLMTFNDESLARAVAACPVPVVTGIGHEPDTSICDMVSDRRCSTPTAAAESVAPSITELTDLLASREQRLISVSASAIASERRTLETLGHRAGRALAGLIAQRSLALDALAKRPCMQGPDALIKRRVSDLDQNEDRMLDAMDRFLERTGEGLDRLRLRLPAPSSLIADRAHDLALASERMRREGASLVSSRASRVGAWAAALDALSPLKVLGRGYAIAYGADGIATSASDFASGDPVTIRLKDGEVAGIVSKVVVQGSAEGKDMRG